MLHRIKLPTDRHPTRQTVVLGEGKPENQNHAIIFAFGEALQSIDANQVCPRVIGHCNSSLHQLHCSSHELPRPLGRCNIMSLRDISGLPSASA